MGELFTITNDIRQIATAAFSDLIVELGKNCKLVYPPTFTECENCYFDSMTGRSNGQYKGGPTPFTDGICPVCMGVGGYHTENSETIRLLVRKTIKPSTVEIPNVRVHNGQLQTRGYLADFPKVMRAEYMLCQLSTENLIEEKYKLLGTPTDKGNIVQNQFFIVTWERV